MAGVLTEAEKQIIENVRKSIHDSIDYIVMSLESGNYYSATHYADMMLEYFSILRKVINAVKVRVDNA